MTDKISRLPERDYIKIYSNGDHYYLNWTNHIRYEALYGKYNEESIGNWVYPEDVLPGQHIKGLS